MDWHATVKTSPIPKIKQRETRKGASRISVAGHYPAEKSFVAERVGSRILEMKTFHVAQA
jgi:hypothetical protein